ncbi:MAG: hypothetical protein Kow0025_10530 [Thermodesulfovibrionales bacterium]
MGDMAASRGRAVLVYDADCPICRRTIGWIEENARKGTIATLPCQSPEVERRFPSVRRASCMRAMQLVLPGGEVLSGEEAVPEILARLKGYSPAARLFSLPGTMPVSRALYRWFADRRYHVADILFPGERGRGGRGKKGKGPKKTRRAGPGGGTGG